MPPTSLDEVVKNDHGDMADQVEASSKTVAAEVNVVPVSLVFCMVFHHHPHPHHHSSTLFWG